MKIPKKDLVLKRSELMKSVRCFFDTRNYQEVDCRSISNFAPVDVHIDIFKAVDSKSTYWLHSSPEIGMKKLLSEGCGNIYQLSHVFRANESSNIHLLEFMMIEWYKIGISYTDFIKETLQLIKLFIGEKDIIVFSYKKIFELHFGVNPHNCSIDKLLYICREKHLPEGLDKDGILDFLMSTFIQPKMPNDKICIVENFPQSQAFMSKTKEFDGDIVSSRFEIYFSGIELANGFDEEKNSDELLKRFEDNNSQRIKLGKNPLPIDQDFLHAMKKGIPECCGCAVGFDRLVMINLSEDDINNVTF